MKKNPKTLVVLWCAAALALTGCSHDTKSADSTQQGGASKTIAAQVLKLSVNHRIHVDQIGYLPQAKKTAVINSNGKSLKRFQVVDTAANKVVLQGVLTGSPEKAEGSSKADDNGSQTASSTDNKSSVSGTAGKNATGQSSVQPVLDQSSGDRVEYADFSSVKKPGHYVVQVPGYGESVPFQIADHVYQALTNGVIKGLYYQRCGFALTKKYAGEWTHPACHLEDGYLYTDPSVKIDVTGGWHDAGDYGKYTVSGANTVALMLLGYEMFPKAYQASIDIPESGNGVPDVLNEARFELDWLMKMQDPKTGGAYHKVTPKNFSGFVMPQDATAKRFVYPVSPTATGDFAAVMAMASRVYQPFDKKFSKQALSASEAAWQWLIQHPDAPGFKNPSDTNSGEYADSQSKDERYWAAVELYRDTKDEVYAQYIQAHFSDNSNTGLGWINMSGFGALDYLMMPGVNKDSDLYQNILQDVTIQANYDAAMAKLNGYRISMTPDDYYWGSNMKEMDDAVLMIAANELSPDPELIQTAEQNLHSLLGENALDHSFVTGFGTDSVMHPHHRPSASDGIEAPVPGLVSGGPNKNLQDSTIQKLLSPDVSPSRAYVDDEGSYSSNEIAIYWNAPVIFVAGYFNR